MFNTVRHRDTHMFGWIGLNPSLNKQLGRISPVPENKGRERESKTEDIFNSVTEQTCVVVALKCLLPCEHNIHVCNPNTQQV